MSFKIIGLGEVLWDLLPTGAQMGGAPANFAYHAGALGARAGVVSRVGAAFPSRRNTVVTRGWYCARASESAHASTSPHFECKADVTSARARSTLS